MTIALDWDSVAKIRGTVERYYQRNSESGGIDIPKYDEFVTIMAADHRRAEYDLHDELDLFKLWAHLSITCEAAVHLIEGVCIKEDGSPDIEQQKGALKVMGKYGNMQGLFLREMSKNVPAIPPAVVLPEPPNALEEDASE